MATSPLRIGAAFSLLLVGIGSCVLTGCTLQTTAAPEPAPAVTISGVVHGGQSPIFGAKVYLLAADETGYGKPSDSLLDPLLTKNPADSIGSYVLSDAAGNFVITSDYVCPEPATQVYVYVSGGDPGFGTNNPHNGLMAALGSCGDLSAQTFIEVNEVTTVAAAYALSGFALDATDISSAPSSLSITGLQNAFLNAAQLADTTYGTANIKTPNGNGTVDQQQIYTLANILASCINTDGADSGPTNPTACYTLFHAATTGGTLAILPGDTATAAINIAHHPGVNVATLAALSTKTSPFPQAKNPPTDLTVGISFDASFINPSETTTGNGAIAIDAKGNAWFGYSFDTAGIGMFSSTGVVAAGEPFTGQSLASPNGILGFPGGIAIDQLGSVWVADGENNQVVRFSSDGTTATSVTGGTMLTVHNVVIDAAGDVWVDNYTDGTELTKIYSPAFLTSAIFTSGFKSTGSFGGFAFDDLGHLWAGQGSTIAEVKSDGTTYTGSPYALTNDSSEATGVAVDSSGAIWIGVAEGDASSTPDIIKLTGSGASETQTEINGGGLGVAIGVAIDGGGNVWVANEDTNFAAPISEFNNAGVALSASGFTGGQAIGPTGIAVDGSGDVWVTNGTEGGPSTVSELIGAAVPVVTPISAGLVTPYTPGSKP